MTTLEKLEQTIKYLRSLTQTIPEVGVVLGSGLGAFANEIEKEIVIPFSQIPHFGTVSVVGHSGNLIIGTLRGKKIAALQGRLHYYEGHSMETVIYPTRVLAKLGVKKLILTNSAGGLGDGMKSGDFMIIRDHINFFGVNPLLGPNMSELGPRFPDMSEAYNIEMSEKLHSVFQKKGLSCHQGIYAGVSGPSYETPAEVRYFKFIGCSAVGMSTVPETIAANHLGLKVAALSCITNLAAGLSAHKLTHDEVTDTAKKSEQNFTHILCDFVEIL